MKNSEEKERFTREAHRTANKTGYPGLLRAPGNFPGRGEPQRHQRATTSWPESPNEPAFLCGRIPQCLPAKKNPGFRPGFWDAGSELGETQLPPLFFPVRVKPGSVDQLLGIEIRRLSPVDDGFDDWGSEEGQLQHPSYIADCDSFFPGNVGYEFPAFRSLNQRCALPKALSNTGSPLPGDLPMIIFNSTPRRFICIGTKRTSLR